MLFLNRFPKKLALPTWVPDFSLVVADDVYNVSIPMGFFEADGNNWANIGLPSPGCALDDNDKPGQLTVSGFQCDSPLAIDRIWEGNPEGRQSTFFEIIKQYQNTLDGVDATRFPDHDKRQRQVAFWHALIWNADLSSRYPAPEIFGLLYHKLIEE